MSVEKLNGELKARALGGGIGCGEATTFANILVDKLHRAVEGVRGARRARADHEDGRGSEPLVFVDWHTFLVGGVDRGRAPANVGLHEPSHVEVDKHNQLRVA